MLVAMLLSNKLFTQKKRNHDKKSSTVKDIYFVLETIKITVIYILHISGDPSII